MFTLKLNKFYLLDNESINIDDEIIPKWKFLERTSSTLDPDILTIRELFRSSESFNRLETFRINTYIVILGDTRIILHKKKSIKVYNSNLFVIEELLHDIFEDINYSEGIHLNEEYDIINNNISFKGISIPLSDFVNICNTITLFDKRLLKIDKKEGTYEYSLEYLGLVSKIDKTEIYTQDLSIFDFLFTTGANLLRMKNFSINNTHYIMSDRYIIKYNENSSDFINYQTDNSREVLSFLSTKLEKYIPEEEPVKKNKLFKRHIKVENKNKIETGKKKSFKDFIGFLLKKPE